MTKYLKIFSVAFLLSTAQYSVAYASEPVGYASDKIQINQPTEEEQIEKIIEGFSRTLGLKKEKEFGTRARNDIEEQIIAIAGARKCLMDVKRSYDERFLEWGSRLSFFFTQIMNKMNIDVAPSDMELLREYVVFRLTVNFCINEIVVRTKLFQTFPDPGKGIFDGDDSDTFKAKLDGMINMTEEIQARWLRLRHEGIDIN